MANLGVSWGDLGTSGGHLGAILGYLGPSWAILGPSWGHLGPILEPPWAILGPSWGHFGPSWGYFTSTLPPADLNQKFKKTCVSSRRNASFWNPPTLAVSRATFGASLGPSWAILEPSRAIGFEEEEVRFVSSLFSELKRKKYDLFPLFFKL